MKYSVLINTCDGFDDCWKPFFTLFGKYWPDCSGGLFLNTEYKDFSFDGLAVNTVKGCLAHGFPKEKRASWSLCLRWALEYIPTDIVLYMQEDYFLKSRVDNDEVERMVRLMEDNPGISCIHLTDQAVKASMKSEHEGLMIVDRRQRYRVSCQAALWRRSELLNLIRDWENAWEFEEFGSRRSSRINSLYLCVDNEIVQLDKYEIIPYIFTGIVQGRWYDPVVGLFENNGITIDYSRRGMSSQRPGKPLSRRIRYRMHRTLYSVRAFIDRMSIKQQSHE